MNGLQRKKIQPTLKSSVVQLVIINKAVLSDLASGIPLEFIIQENCEGKSIQRIGFRSYSQLLHCVTRISQGVIAHEGKIAYIKFEDKVSGELFAQAPAEQYPGIAVETVTDSSCYFVIRIQDGTGHSAFIGIGFSDRGDAFDFNVSLQDHFKWVKQESEISKESQEMDNRPKLDLGFKEGQTIKLRTTGAGGLSLLPPPPGGRVTIPPPSSSVAIGNHVHPPPIPKSNHGGSDADILLDLDSPAPVTTPAPAPVSASNDLWGDFSTASSSVPN
eukprot:bmy_18379T0